MIGWHQRLGVGFTQLYLAFSSVSAARIFILNDLFVVHAARRHGVASALLHSAAKFGKANGAVRLRSLPPRSFSSFQKRRMESVFGPGSQLVSRLLAIRRLERDTQSKRVDCGHRDHKGELEWQIHRTVHRLQFEELLVSSLAQTDALAKLLIEKGIVTQQEFLAKISEERATYQAMFKPTPH